MARGGTAAAANRAYLARVEKSVIRAVESSAKKAINSTLRSARKTSITALASRLKTERKNVKDRVYNWSARGPFLRGKIAGYYQGFSLTRLMSEQDKQTWLADWKVWRYNKGRVNPPVVEYQGVRFPSSFVISYRDRLMVMERIGNSRKMEMTRINLKEVVYAILSDKLTVAKDKHFERVFVKDFYGTQKGLPGRS